MESVGIIGGGPAGLRTAEVAAQRGFHVTLYDAMPSVGRKFLVAGKSGLNITNNEDWKAFLTRYSGTELPIDLWNKILTSFDNTALRDWAKGLDIETFVASSGKVFPAPDQGGMKAAPLLRRWVQQLRHSGVIFKMNHRWTAIKPNKNELTAAFSHQQKNIHHTHDAIVLALGGGSWKQTGSDGAWVHILNQLNIQTTPLTAANCGWEADWSEKIIQEAEGLPLKNLLIKSGKNSHRGELIITRYGLEGAPIYHLGSTLKKQKSPYITIDFKPDLTHEELVSRLGNPKRNFIREARRRWKLDPATCALLKHLPDRGPWRTAEQLAHEAKNCSIPLTRPRPLDEAISSAGGICWSELDNNLMLKKIPNLYAVGEMIDWEAPTGGYLLQACFATGTHVGKNLSC